MNTNGGQNGGVEGVRGLRENEAKLTGFRVGTLVFDETKPIGVVEGESEACGQTNPVG